MYKMRDMKRLMVEEKAGVERRQKRRKEVGEKEDWGPWFGEAEDSHEAGDERGVYSKKVERKLEGILGRKGLEVLRKSGVERAKESEDEEQDEGGSGEEEMDDDIIESRGNQQKSSKEKENKDTKENGIKQMSNLELLKKEVKPWEVTDREDRTEVVLGVRYNKSFENQFDDKSVLGERRPMRIIRVMANYNREYIVGIQFTYMTEEKEVVKGKLHGNNKKIIDNLQSVQYEIQYREKIDRIVAHFSKGIHWMVLMTTEGREILLGNKIDHFKAVTQSKELNSSKNEEICYVSGGHTGKDYRFTFISFHLQNGWGKAPKIHF